MTRCVPAIAALISIAVAGVPDSDQSRLERAVAEARASYGIPALGTLVLEDGEIRALAVAGRRSLAVQRAATAEDRWELASNGKPMTATLLARLVEQEKIGFDSKLEAVFPDLAESMHPAFREVTVRMLLNHSAGLPFGFFETEEEYYERFLGTRESLRTQRLWVARESLAQAPSYRPGSEHVYSNLGYIIAGAVAERVGRRPWEQLIATEVFKPLGITSYGFGAPGSPGIVDQPWGHRIEGPSLVPVDPGNPRADGVLVEAPAGMIHMSLRDWARFAQENLDGASGPGRLLSNETYLTLHRPVDGSSDALGWGAVIRDGELHNLQHTGGTESWKSLILLYPRERRAILQVANDGREEVWEAFRMIRAALREHARSPDD